MDKKKFPISKKQSLLSKISEKLSINKQNNIRKNQDNNFDFENLDTFIHIPKKNRKKNPASLYYMGSEEKENSNKKKTSNIINIVNNLKGKKDSLLKLNINQYDIKCYLPKANLNNLNDNNNNKKNYEKKESRKSSNSLCRTASLNISKKSNNNLDVDIINFQRKNEEKNFDEKKLRRQILHKVKSYNEIQDNLQFGKRPKLKNSEENFQEDNKDKLSNNSYDIGSDKIIFRQMNINTINSNDTLCSKETISDKSNSIDNELINSENENLNSSEGSNFTMNEQKGRKLRNKWFRIGETEKIEHMQTDNSNLDLSDSRLNNTNGFAITLPDKDLESDNNDEYDNMNFEEMNDNDNNMEFESEDRDNNNSKIDYGK